MFLHGTVAAAAQLDWVSIIVPLLPPTPPPSQPPGIVYSSANYHLKIFGACVSRGGGKTNWNNFLINFPAISGDSKNFSFFSTKTKILTPRGKGAPPIFFLTPNLIFCNLKPHSKFQNPTITPSGRKASVGEEKREKNCKIVT